MPRTAFLPGRHGFHFANRFVNTLAKIPGRGDIQTYGRCGGMAYAALDYYFAGLTIPSHDSDDFPSTGVPADGTRLADWLLSRLLQTYLVPSALKFIAWTVLGDGEMPFFKGVTRATKEDEFAALRTQIDAGRPVPLGLVCATNLRDIGANHQVVAYGYDLDPSGGITVYIYDNNFPNADDVVLTSGPADPHFHQSTGQEWRGFFIQEYRFQRPTYLDLALASNILVTPEAPAIGQRVECVWTVRNYGDYPSHLRRLALTVQGPAGESVDDLLGLEGETLLQPDEERQVSAVAEAFGSTAGQYTVTARYLSAWNHWLDLPPGAPEVAPLVVLQIAG